MIDLLSNKVDLPSDSSPSMVRRAGSGIADTMTTVFGVVWALLFALFPLFTRDRMRIGDLLAGTWVIEAPKPEVSSERG
ncbi:hypothetical protein SLT36_32020 (plasmid) [Aminobacter sp. BA135]|uniref:hypothetical protein n=1 Tax=Aminobacter sp. BA135 TaxID=537596 RepID=UPI003D7C103E